LQRITYGGVSAALLVPFGLGAGWGLVGEQTGTGVFGSIRVYGRQWEFNGGIHRWLDAGLTRLGVVNADVVARWAVVSVMVGLLLAVWTRARQAPTLAALRLMAVPLMAFVLMSPTVHPWYMLMVVAWLPFLTPTTDEPARRWLELVPWLYLSAALVFSYLTYRDPLRFAEVDWVRRLEWLPTLVLLGAIPLVGRLRPAVEKSAAVEVSEAQAG
jgi:hypothetical protein